MSAWLSSTLWTMSTQLHKASWPVRPSGKCDVTLKDTCGMVFVREVVNSPRMRTVLYDSLLQFAIVR